MFKQFLFEFSYSEWLFESYENLTVKYWNYKWKEIDDYLNDTDIIDKITVEENS